MARPRQRPSPTPYQRRQARARALGYKSYYDYRIHGNGRIPPGKPPVAKGKRAALRGHSLERWRRHGQSAAMLRAIEPGVTISLTQPVSQIQRLRNGVYPRIDKLLIGNDGLGQEFTIRNVTRAQLIALIREEVRRGGAFVAAPSFDQRRLVSEDEL